MSTLKLRESTSTLEIFQKLLDLEMPVKSSALYLNDYFVSCFIFENPTKRTICKDQDQQEALEIKRVLSDSSDHMISTRTSSIKNILLNNS